MSEEKKKLDSTPEEKPEVKTVKIDKTGKKKNVEEEINEAAVKAVEKILEKKKDDSGLIENKPIEVDASVEKEIKVDFFLDDKEEVKPVLETKSTELESTVKRAKSVDMSTITVLNKNEMDKERDLKSALYGNKAAFQIVAAQSGYMAKVLPLVNKDIVNILSGNLSRFEYRRNVYKVVWEKIYDTSVGRFQFEDWLKATSIEDMETFYYGIYASTFPNEGTFRFVCPNPNCGEESEYKVNHANLIKTADRDKMKKLIDEVSKNAVSIEKMKEFSLIGKNEAVQLTDSKIIFELRTPSLFDSLEILRTIPEKTIDRDAVSVTNMLYISSILIPSKESNGYISETNKQSILRIIDNLSIDDSLELQTAVSDRVDENRITYSIKSIKCSKCGQETNEIPLSIEDILFTLIFERFQ
jgi:hypothetical protein